MNLEEYIRKIESSKIIDNLAELYPDFPFRCHEISNIIFKFIEDNVGIWINGNRHIHIIHGCFEYDNHHMNHWWIDCGDFIIDATLIQFTAPKTKEFMQFGNFPEYFKNNDGPTKTIIDTLGGIMIDKKSSIYKKYTDSNIIRYI